MIDRQEFLDVIFGDIADGEFVCVSEAKPKADGSGVWFFNHLETDRAWRKWDAAKQARAFYYNVSTISGELNDKGTMVRRGRANLVRYHVLVLDDIGQKTGEPPVEPSYKLESSAGSFQWGYLLEPGTDFDRYEALVDAIHKLGFGDAGAGGSYRLVRVVGSANLKPGRDNFRSRITEWEPDRYWTLDELAEAFGVDLSKVPLTSAATTSKTGGAEAMEGIDPMLDWLAAEGHVTKDGGAQWVEMVCPWADAHTSGSNTAGYSPLGRGDGRWVTSRSFSCKHEHCADKKLKDLVKWAEPQGGPFVSGYDPLPWLQAQYAYVETGQVVVDLAQRPVGGVWRWSFADWQKRHPGKVRTLGRDAPVSVATAFVESVDTKKAVDVVYKPVRREDDTGIVRAFNQDYVNTYVPPNWPETDETPEIFLDHMEYLIPCAEEREVFLNWLAHKLQHPHKRSYAIVMVAENTFGTGRSWIKGLLAKMLQGGVETATLAQIVGHGTQAQQNYNSWEVGCQFIVCEEARDTMTREEVSASYQVFKTRCDTSPSEVRVNEKYGLTRNGWRYWNALIFSNHADAMAVEANDRRIYVITNPTERRDLAYYDRLQGALDGDEPARAYWWLMRRDVSGYDRIYPPFTAAKAAMIEHSSSPGDDIMAWLADNHPADLVTPATLRAGVMVAASALNMDKVVREPGNLTKRLWRNLKSLRPEDVKHGARYMIGGSQAEVRALRNKGKWILVDNTRDVGVIAEEVARKVNIVTVVK